MFFKKIEIDNIGPIKHLCVEFPKDGQRPKPLIIVGENGSGKSIFLSHLVNALTTGKQEVYDDVEVEKGKVFKYRSPSYITSGESYSFSNVEFESGEKVQEWQLVYSRADFEEKLGYTPIRAEWNQIPITEHSLFTSTFKKTQENTKKIFAQQCCLYFPVNRFEEPAWLNLKNLTAKANYTELSRLSGYSNREIICTSPLKNNNNWLLDLFFDRELFDRQTRPLPVWEERTGRPGVHWIDAHIGEYYGSSSTICEAVIRIIRVILQKGSNVRLGADTRKNRRISVIKDEKNWVPNLFHLSTGELQLVNLFISIIRDYDLSEAEFKSIIHINGIVIIDEIDSHLHTKHQKEILPALINLFPNVQFIVTTHSPLFLLGMEQALGKDGFEIINMPNGERILADDFSEFIAAYESFRETARHREEIISEINRNAKPIVFVEGDYDIRYLQKAAELLGKIDVLEKIQLKDGDGYGNLDKIWKNLDNPISGVIKNKIILLYDCDTNKKDAQRNFVFKRVLPSVQNNPISIGIENLFSIKTIEKAEIEKICFIDIVEATTRRVRGKEEKIPVSKAVNKDEKSNMCNWLCENGTVEDFSGFKIAFEIIESIING